jgi:hypothetical protein
LPVSNPLSRGLIRINDSHISAISAFPQERDLSCPFTLAILFPVEKQTCGPEARALRPKSIGSVIPDCGFRISDFGFFWFSFSIRNPHLNCPPDPMKE